MTKRTGRFKSRGFEGPLYRPWTALMQKLDEAVDRAASTVVDGVKGWVKKKTEGMKKEGGDDLFNKVFSVRETYDVGPMTSNGSKSDATKSDEPKLTMSEEAKKAEEEARKSATDRIDSLKDPGPIYDAKKRELTSYYQRLYQGEKNWNDTEAKAGLISKAEADKRNAAARNYYERALEKDLHAFLKLLLDDSP